MRAFLAVISIALFCGISPASAQSSLPSANTLLVPPTSECQVLLHKLKTRPLTDKGMLGAAEVLVKGRRKVVLIDALSVYGVTWVPLKPLSDAIGCSLDTVSKSIFSLTPPPAVPDVRKAITDDKDSLAGMKDVSVFVNVTASDPLTQALSRVGVTKSQLQTEIELKLRSNGIAVDDDANAHAGTLKADFTFLDNGAGGFCYSIDLCFFQPLRLDRDLSVWTYGQTWHTGGIGYSPTSSALSALTGDADTYVSDFCNDYLAENPITH